jgi:DNA-binding CsgD family transcriptional regulator
MSNHLIEFEECLANTRGASAGFKLVQQALMKLGVDDFSYTRLSPISLDNRISARNVIFTTYNASMMRKLGGFQGFADDLTRLRAEVGLDTVWTDDSAWDRATPLQMYQYELQRAGGLRNGYTHVLGKIGVTTATIGLRLDTLSATEFRKDWPQLSKIILPIAQIMHRHFNKHHVPQNDKLSAREKDVLLWLAMGLRPEEIADQLNIGYRCVDKYIVSAKDRLGAKSRDHAVARALSLGLLDI